MSPSHLVILRGQLIPDILEIQPDLLKDLTSRPVFSYELKMRFRFLPNYQTE